MALPKRLHWRSCARSDVPEASLPSQLLGRSGGRARSSRGFEQVMAEEFVPPCSIAPTSYATSTPT